MTTVHVLTIASLDPTPIAPGGSELTVQAVMTLLAACVLAFGLFFMVVGAMGVLRMPDAYQRLHAASKCTTLGLTGMLLATVLHLPDIETVSKAIITIVFTIVAAPIGSHLLAKAAHHGELKQWRGTLSDELAADKRSPDRAASDDAYGIEGRPAPEPAAPAPQSGGIAAASRESG